MVVAKTIAVADVILKDRGFSRPADMQPIRLISVHRVVQNFRASTSIDANSGRSTGGRGAVSIHEVIVNLGIRNTARR